MSIFRRFLETGQRTFLSILGYLQLSMGRSTYTYYNCGTGFPSSTITIPYNPNRISIGFWACGAPTNGTVQFGGMETATNIFLIFDSNEWTFHYAKHGEMVYQDVIVTIGSGNAITVIERVRV